MRPGNETWQKLHATLTRGRQTAARASGRARQRGRELGQHLTPRAPNVAQTTPAEIPVGGPGRWVRAVDGELVNLDGCDYVAVEQERGGSCVVVARMHGGAENWVLARYERRSDATRALDWLAGHLDARRLDLVAVAEAEGDSGPGQATE
jgi:hypothetical protein